jgi:hypothetical protein
MLPNEHVQAKHEFRQAVKELSPALQLRLSRALLWHTPGSFKSLQGWSGSPLEILEEGTEETKAACDGWRILGF